MSNSLNTRSCRILRASDSISTAIVKQWIVWVSENWSPKTSNNAQSVLNIILKAAVEKGFIKSNPSQNLTFRKVQKKDRELLTLEEVRQIYRSPLWGESGHRDVFLVASVIALRGEDVGEDFLNIRHSYSVKFGLGPTKTRVNRYVPIPRGLVAKKDGWLFKSVVSKGKPVSAHGVYMIFRKVCESLGIDSKGRGLTIHTLRNFFISYMQGRNVPLQKIKAVVGHADESMTDWYTYWNPTMFEEVYAEQTRLLEFITGA